MFLNAEILKTPNRELKLQRGDKQTKKNFKEEGEKLEQAMLACEKRENNRHKTTGRRVERETSFRR